MNAPPLAAHQAESSALKLRRFIGPDPSHVDLHLMLLAWHSGTAAGREVALQMADFDRTRALSANNGDAK